MKQKNIVKVNVRTNRLSKLKGHQFKTKLDFSSKHNWHKIKKINCYKNWFKTVSIFKDFLIVSQLKTPVKVYSLHVL